MLETCQIGMISLFENNPQENLFNDLVLKEVKDHHFKVDSINLVKVLTGYRCDVITQDSKGFRSFRVTLEKNSKFTHFYRIIDIKEQKLISRYQWEDL